MVFQRAKDESHTLLLSPKKGDSEMLIGCFTSKTNILSMTLCCKVSLR